MSSVQPMDPLARKKVSPAHILWNIVTEADVFQQLKKSWIDESDKNADRKANKKRPGEHSLINDDGRISKRKQQSTRLDLVTPSTPIGVVPWTKSKLYTNDIMGLHDEIYDLYRWLCPRKWEIALRRKIVAKIKAVVKDLWPCSRVRVFGSTRTKLFLPTSDLDIVVSGINSDIEYESGEPNHKNAVELLVQLRQSLVGRNITDDAHSVVIDKAQVPIVKLTDLSTKLSVDITFSAASSINAVKFVNDWQHRYFHTLRPLAFVLKQFIAHRELNEVFHGGLSSYGLILMLINFFQLHERGYDAAAESSNLGVLLLEFLELYGTNFNYRVVGIDPTGQGARFRRRDGDGENPQQQHLLSVLDPFNKDNDVTRGSFAFEKVQSAFHFAYCELEALIRPSSISTNREPHLVPSILSSVMQIHPETVFHRVWAARAFNTFVSQYGSDIDDRPMDWEHSEVPSDDEGNGADSFENDDDSSVKDCTHSRTTSATVGDSAGNSVDGESPLSNYADEVDRFDRESPSLFVKFHNGLPSARSNHPVHPAFPHNHPNPMHSHLHHHQFPLPHLPNHQIMSNFDSAQHRQQEMHRSASLPFANMNRAKVLPVTNAVLPIEAQEELTRLFQFTRAHHTMIPHSLHNQAPLHQSQAQHSTEPMQMQQPQNQPLPASHGRRNEGGNWNQAGSSRGAWVNVHGGRRSAAGGNASEPSPAGNDPPPIMQSMPYAMHNPNLPRRFHQQQPQNQGGPLQRRGGSDRYGRMHNNNANFSPFGGHHQHQGHHYSNYSQNQGGQRMNSYGSFRRNSNSNIQSNNNNNSRHQYNARATQQTHYQQQEAIVSPALSDLDSSSVSEAYNPDEVISMKIDRKKHSPQQRRQSEKQMTADSVESSTSSTNTATNATAPSSSEAK